jgi:hypothetical protein
MTISDVLNLKAHESESVHDFNKEYNATEAIVKEIYQMDDVSQYLVDIISDFRSTSRRSIPADWDVKEENIFDSLVVNDNMDSLYKYPKLETSTCSEDSPCGMCKGRCFSDNDCSEGLKCYHQTSFDQEVPGCTKK